VEQFLSVRPKIIKEEEEVIIKRHHLSKIFIENFSFKIKRERK